MTQEDYQLFEHTRQGKPISPRDRRRIEEPSRTLQVGLFVLCRVPDGTPVYHGTAKSPSSCTVLCKVASLTGRGHDASMTADRTSRQGRDMQNTVQAYGAVP